VNLTGVSSRKVNIRVLDTVQMAIGGGQQLASNGMSIPGRECLRIHPSPLREPAPSLLFRPMATQLTCSIVPLWRFRVRGMNAHRNYSQLLRTMNSAEQFEAIVGAQYEPLFRFAMSLTRSEADACDLTQQTFSIWAAKGHQLRDISKVKTWLFTTLHREFLVGRRKECRYPHDHLEEVSEQLPTHSPEFANDMDSAQVLAALAEVDQVYRAAVALFYLQDWSYKEIAFILDVPIGTVKSRIGRGIAQLREILLADVSEWERDSSAILVQEPLNDF
jgi:RNA polymerase sigma-70 factor (ECF subfamily)